jgi:hypothetical protein
MVDRTRGHRKQRFAICEDRRPDGRLGAIIEHGAQKASPTKRGDQRIDLRLIRAPYSLLISSTSVTVLRMSIAVLLPVAELRVHFYS